MEYPHLTRLSETPPRLSSYCNTTATAVVTACNATNSSCGVTGYRQYAKNEYTYLTGTHVCKRVTYWSTCSYRPCVNITSSTYHPGSSTKVRILA